MLSHNISIMGAKCKVVFSEDKCGLSLSHVRANLLSNNLMVLYGRCRHRRCRQCYRHLQCYIVMVINTNNTLSCIFHRLFHPYDPSLHIMSSFACLVPYLVPFLLFGTVSLVPYLHKRRRRGFFWLSEILMWLACSVTFSPYLFLSRSLSLPNSRSLSLFLSLTFSHEMKNIYSQTNDERK